MFSFGQSFSSCRQELAFFHCSRLKLNSFRCDFIQIKVITKKKRKEESLTCPSSCTGRLSTGRKKSDRGGAEAERRPASGRACLSRLTLPLFSTETMGKSTAVCPAASCFHVPPLRLVCSQGFLLYVSRSFTDIKSLLWSMNGSLLAFGSLFTADWVLIGLCLGSPDCSPRHTPNAQSAAFRLSAQTRTFHVQITKLLFLKTSICQP